MVEYDEIGIWSEVKLAIIKEYASAYSKILDATRREAIHNLKWLYIDAFAGPGVHLSRRTGEIVEGSPLIALKTTPPFSEYHFIDADLARAEQLKTISGSRNDVHIYSEDCNDVLLRDVFPCAIKLLAHAQIVAPGQVEQIRVRHPFACAWLKASRT